MRHPIALSYNGYYGGLLILLSWFEPRWSSKQNKIRSMVTVKKFGATWCGPCRAIAPIIVDLKEEFEGRAEIIDIDVDENSEEATAYKISSIPVVIIEKDGEIVQRMVGVNTKAKYVVAIEEALK